MASSASSLSRIRMAPCAIPIVVNSVFAAILITLTDLLSPIYPQVIEAYSDQYIFELTGKIWAEGGVPYVDFWDQKGPMIFLFNMVGWKLTGSALGIFLLTIIWAAITVNMLYLIAKEFVPKRYGTVAAMIIAWISAIWIGILCAPSWDMTEPLCLPFLALSLLIAVRWFKQTNHDSVAIVPWWHPFVYGISFSVCLLSRLTNALSVCVSVLVIAMVLLRWKQWAALFKCALTFIPGVALPLVPFCIYFAVHHALYDFIYGTVLFNINYAENSGGLLSEKPSTIVLILLVPCAMVLTSLAHMLLERHFNLTDCTIAIPGILFVALFLNINPYHHYAAIAAIFLPILLGIACQYAGMRWQTLAVLGLIMALLCGCHAVQDNKFIWSQPVYDEPELEQVIQKANGSVVLYNIKPNAYLQYNLTPIYRFAWLQDWEASCSDSYTQLLRDEFVTAQAEYIVVQHTTKPTIDNILRRQYRPVQTITIKGTDAVVYKRR